MKRVLIYLLLMLCVVRNQKALAQTIINISTGVNLTGGLLPPSTIGAPSFDNNWTAQTQPGGAFNPLPICTGMLPGNVIANGTVPNVRWVSPFVDQQGNFLNAPPGSFSYRMIFNLSLTCPVQSAVFNFIRLNRDDFIPQFSLNGTNLLVNGPLNAISAFSNFNINAQGALNPNGQNVLIITVVNAAASATGMQIDGNLTIQTSNFTNYALADQSGNVKTSFCTNEDIFIKGTGAVSSKYKLELMYNNLVLWQPMPFIAFDLNFTGSPNGVNITDIFGNQQNPYVFIATPNSGGFPYNLRLTIYGACQPQQVINLPFRYDCCPGAEAPFNLNFTNGGSKIEGKSLTNGAHAWKIYSISDATGEPTLLGNPNTLNFSLNTTSRCYFVKHTVTTNGCGSVCTARSFCNYNCGAKECDMARAVPLHWDPAIKRFTWTSVPGATYILEIKMNDPACLCPQPDGGLPGGAVTQPLIKTFQVADNFYDLNPAVDLPVMNETAVLCFSWRVKTVCPDGFTSGFSQSRCSWQLRPANPLQTAISENGSVNTEVTIFPNPANDQVSIDIKTQAGVNLKINIFDATGRIVKEFDEISTIDKVTSVKWDSHLMCSGIYLVKVETSDDVIFTKKLVIE